MQNVEAVSLIKRSQFTEKELWLLSEIVKKYGTYVAIGHVGHKPTTLDNSSLEILGNCAIWVEGSEPSRQLRVKDVIVMAAILEMVQFWLGRGAGAYLLVEECHVDGSGKGGMIHKTDAGPILRALYSKLRWRE